MVLDDKYLELVKEAIALQCNGEYDKALDKYKEAFELTATVHDISSYALCEYSAGYKEEGKELIKKMIKKYPKFPFLYMDYTTMLAKEDNIEEAIKMSKKGLSVVSSKDPNKESYLSLINLDLAKINYGKKEYDTAIKHAIESLKHQKDFDAYYILICIYEDIKDYPNQLKYALELKNSFPEEKNVYFLLGNAYRNNNERSKALECFKKEVERENPNPYAFFNLSLEYLNINELENAKMASLKALELEKDDPDVWFNLGCVYSQMEDWENTKSVLKAYLYMVDGNDEAITNDPDLEGFRKTNEYLELMAMNKKK